LIVIGGILLLVASRLPWWTVEWARGTATSTDAFDYGMTGVVPLAILLVVTVLTVIIKTDSLPLPTWLVHPYLTTLAVAAATVLVGIRFFWSGFEDTSGVTRGLGLYLAAAAVVLAAIGCGLAIRDLRRDVPEDELDDVAFEDDDEDEDEDDVYDVADDDEDDLAARYNATLPIGEPPVPGTSSLAPRPRRTPDEGQPAPRRRSTRLNEPGTARRTRRRPAGPPIP
jgi:hypothetical protein